MTNKAVLCSKRDNYGLECLKILKIAYSYKRKSKMIQIRVKYFETLKKNTENQPS